MEHLKEAFEEYVADGVDYLANLHTSNLKKSIEVVFIEPLVPPEKAIASANEKARFANMFTGSFRMLVEKLVVYNIFVVYESNPNIHMDDAIRIAFTSGMITELFQIEDLKRAARKAVPNRK